MVLVVPGNGTTSLESAYSSLSRGQEEIHVFADTTTHGPDPLAHLAERWAHPEPKRTATARARELAGMETRGPVGDPYADLRPDDQERLSGPMTRRQQTYLAHLAAEAGEEMPKGLTKAEASHRIGELQQRSGRQVPEWAQHAAAELAELATIADTDRSPAPPPPTPGRPVALPVSLRPPAPNFEPEPAELSPPAVNFDPDLEVADELGLEVERYLRPPGHGAGFGDA